MNEFDLDFSLIEDITKNNKPLDSFQLKVAIQWLNNENITFNLLEENTTFKIPSTIEAIIWSDEHFRKVR